MSSTKRLESFEDFIHFMNDFISTSTTLMIDYELQTLLIQLLFNFRKNMATKMILQNSPHWAPILKMTAKNFDIVKDGCRDLCLKLDRDGNSVKSVKIVEIHHAFKIYAGLYWLDFNQDSLTCNVSDDPNQPVMIEILYQDIREWSVHQQDVLECVKFFELIMIQGTRIKIGIFSMSDLMIAKSLFEARIAKEIRARKRSVVQNPSQNVENEIIAEYDEIMYSESPPPLEPSSSYCAKIINPSPIISQVVMKTPVYCAKEVGKTRNGLLSPPSTKLKLGKGKIGLDKQVKLAKGKPMKKVIKYIKKMHRNELCNLEIELVKETDYLKSFLCNNLKRYPIIPEFPPILLKSTCQKEKLPMIMDLSLPELPAQPVTFSLTEFNGFEPDDMLKRILYNT